MCLGAMDKMHILFLHVNKTYNVLRYKSCMLIQFLMSIFQLKLIFKKDVSDIKWIRWKQVCTDMQAEGNAHSDIICSRNGRKSWHALIRTRLHVPVNTFIKLLHGPISHYSILQRMNYPCAHKLRQGCKH